MKKLAITLSVVCCSAVTFAATPTFQQNFEDAKENADLPRCEGVSGKGVQLKQQKLRIAAKDRLTPAEGTISFWFKPVNWETKDKEFKFLAAGEMPKGKSGRLMIYKYRNPGLGLIFFFGQSNGKAGKDFTYANSEKVEIQKGQWYFLAVTWSKKNTRLNLYLNGKKINSSSVNPAAFFPELENIVINPSSYSPSNPKHETCYDTIRLFNTALTDAEIATLYQQK